MNFEIPNYANKNGQVKNEFHCHKGNTTYSPELKWNSISNAKCYSIVMEDPDAPSGTFVHWFIPFVNKDINQIDSLRHNKSNHELLQLQRLYIQMNEPHIIQGYNSGGFMGYYPPCPPSGTHRYIFTLLALGAETKDLHWDKKSYTLAEWKKYLESQSIPIINEEIKTFYCKAYNNKK